MRISLAVGMIPRTGTMGTHVRVPSGKWKVEHNCKDSKLSIIVNDIESDLDTLPISLDGVSTVQIKVAKGGTERFILAYVEAA